MILAVYSQFLTFYVYCWHITKVAGRDGRWSNTISGGHSYFTDNDMAIPPPYTDSFGGNLRDVLMFNSGALELILTALTDNIVKEMQSLESADERISEVQSRVLTTKLRGIYAHLKEHPALFERRLYVGSQRPDIPPYQVSRLKRTFDSDIAQPACPSSTAWRLLRHAKDINDTEVEVFQPEHGSTRIKQWFYTVTCNNRSFRSRRDCPGCCIGIAHDRYNSSCRQKKTYVMALVRSPKDGTLDWNWIQVNTGCNCAISEKFEF